MTIHISDLIVLFLSGAGLLICFTLGTSLLFRTKGVNLTNKILGLLLILYALTTLNGLMALTGVLSQNKHLYFLPIIFNLSIAPLYYLFIKSKTDPTFRLEKKSIAHFIIPVLQFGFYLSIGFRSIDYKSMIWREVVGPYGFIEEVLFILLGIFYLTKVWHILYDQDSISSWKKPVYTWLKRFSFYFMILLVFHSGYEVIAWITWEGFGIRIFNTIWSTLPLKLADVFLSLLIGYNAYLYQNQSIINQSGKASRQDLKDEIDRLLTEEKAYLDPELDLPTFSKKVGVHRNEISSFLSNQNLTFRGLINQKRVEEFIAKTKTNDINKFSMLGLAYMSGFNSKASFNRVFKESTGQTPSAYLKQNGLILQDETNG
ncbi:MAG: helix-turn-helix domain-containing protein [Bacteroidota bacterium]